MSYLIHFNPNHDKLGRFTFSKNNNDSITSKYTAESLKNKKSNIGSKLAFQMRKDFTDAYNKNGPGKNVKEYDAKMQKLSDEADKMAKDYFKKNGLSLKDVDAYYDQAYLFFDQLCEKTGYNVYDKDIAHLKDLGYNESDAKKVAEWMGTSIPWGNIWSEKANAFVESGGIWNEKIKAYEYFDENGKVKYAIGGRK